MAHSWLDRHRTRVEDNQPFEGQHHDVGPLSRQLLTRAEGFFDDLLSLTLSNKLIRCQVTPVSYVAAAGCRRSARLR